MANQYESIQNKIDIKRNISISYIYITIGNKTFIIIIITTIHWLMSHCNNPWLSSTIFRFICFLNIIQRNDVFHSFLSFFLLVNLLQAIDIDWQFVQNHIRCNNKILLKNQ